MVYVYVCYVVVCSVCVLRLRAASAFCAGVLRVACCARLHGCMRGMHVL